MTLIVVTPTIIAADTTATVSIGDRTEVIEDFSKITKLGKGVQVDGDVDETYPVVAFSGGAATYYMFVLTLHAMETNSTTYSVDEVSTALKSAADRTGEDIQVIFPTDDGAVVFEYSKATGVVELRIDSGIVLGYGSGYRKPEEVEMRSVNDIFDEAIESGRIANNTEKQIVLLDRVY